MEVFTQETVTLTVHQAPPLPNLGVHYRHLLSTHQILNLENILRSLKKSNTDLKLGDFHSKLQQSSVPNPPWPAVYTEPFSRAAVLRVSVSKPVSGFYREVSLVLSISSGEDKKTDGTGQVRGPCCGWQVCLFGLSQISCSSPPPTLLRLCLQPDLEVTTQRRIKATFQHRVNTIHPTHHSDRLKTHGASVGLLPCSDKNNNGLIYTCGAAWAEV